MTSRYTKTGEKMLYGKELVKSEKAAAANVRKRIKESIHDKLVWNNETPESVVAWLLEVERLDAAIAERLVKNALNKYERNKLRNENEIF